MDAYCTDHKHLGSHSGISLAESQTAALLNTTDSNPESNPELIHHLKAIALREEMMARAETYDIEITIDYIQDAKAALGKAATVDDVELGQMFFQFKRLDADGDGAFTEGDFSTWIHRIDPDFKNEEGVINQWLRKVTVDGQDSFSFPGYYDMILAHRELENNNWGLEPGTEIPLEFRQTPFWDLRTVVLHALAKERCGWMLKRGYLFAKESLNSWKLRYLRTNTSRPYEPPTVEYWDADPNVDPTKLPEGVPLPVRYVLHFLPQRDEFVCFVDSAPGCDDARSWSPFIVTFIITNCVFNISDFFFFAGDEGIDSTARHRAGGLFAQDPLPTRYRRCPAGRDDQGGHVCGQRDRVEDYACQWPPLHVCL